MSQGVQTLHAYVTFLSVAYLSSTRHACGRIHRHREHFRYLASRNKRIFSNLFPSQRSALLFKNEQCSVLLGLYCWSDIDLLAILKHTEAYDMECRIAYCAYIVPI